MSFFHIQESRNIYVKCFHEVSSYLSNLFKSVYQILKVSLQASLMLLFKFLAFISKKFCYAQNMSQFCGVYVLFFARLAAV